MKRYILYFIAFNLLISGCASRQAYVIMPDPYQQSIDRQIALRATESQERQAESQERQAESQERQAESQERQAESQERQAGVKN